MRWLWFDTANRFDRWLFFYPLIFVLVMLMIIVIFGKQRLDEPDTELKQKIAVDSGEKIRAMGLVPVK